MKHILLAGLVSLSFVTSAQAGLITFTDRATWEAQLSAFQTESFTLPDTGTLAANVTHTLGLVTFSYPGVSSQGFPQVSSNQFVGDVWSVSSGGGTSETGPHTFGLPSAVTAVGADFSSAERSTLTAGGMTVTVPTDSGVQFFGVISDTPFSSFVLDHNQTATTNNDLFIMDNLSFGNTAAVPEPSTFALLGIGGIALVGYGVRRRRQQAA
ncbi:PEP-CTERM sorting domain-containing protein [Symmachiella dynata]|uniref:PEP-CTERM sorting domain-containing protein n=1 Tax=Symmachiella dynata TaxID=2527995 RepID=UPI0030EF99C3|tara:strand:+ start:556 stop:1188 length:633 start_codon:yes stop_codon:yes gene_type:complete